MSYIFLINRHYFFISFREHLVKNYRNSTVDVSNRSFFKYLIISGCAGSSLLHWFSLVAKSRAYSRVAVLRWFLVSQSQALEHRLSSWGARAPWFPGMGDLLGSKTEALSPAVAGGFLATEPPGKPCCFHNECGLSYFSRV